MDALPALWIVFAAFFAAGSVKGIASVGLPMTALGILTFFTDPRTAFACALCPIFASNALQTWRAGNIGEAARRYWPFIVCMVIGIPLTLAATIKASDALLMGVLGVTVLVFVAINITRWAPRISDTWDRAAQIGFGSGAGLLGGLTSIWLPAIMIYLLARDTSKEEFVRATGLLLFTGSLPLFAGYIAAGFLTGPLAVLSLILIVPTWAGMALGARFRGRLSEDAFRKVLLGVFALIGVNLIRRSIL
ncbi:MAG: sulfite exporter TauE/SafE family protein [Silicimonas sp.]|nr:sulfite exporter TauE/SafE family protein [Silicimonas sp.]